jgi:hypothetical protein
MNQCGECGRLNGEHEEWCEIGSTWPIPWTFIVIAILAAGTLALWLFR